jgi:hypothetical protein
MPTYKVLTGNEVFLDFASVDKGGGIQIPEKTDTELQRRVGNTTGSYAPDATSDSGIIGLLKRVCYLEQEILNKLPSALEDDQFRVSYRTAYYETSTTSAVTVGTAFTNLLVNLDCRSFSRATFHLNNTGSQPLTNIQIYISRSSIAPNFVLHADGSTGSFDSANLGVTQNNVLRRTINCSSSVHTLAAGATGWIELNIKGLTAMSIVARTASGTTTLMAYAYVN